MDELIVKDAPKESTRVPGLLEKLSKGARISSGGSRRAAFRERHFAGVLIITICYMEGLFFGQVYRRKTGRPLNLLSSRAASQYVRNRQQNEWLEYANTTRYINKMYADFQRLADRGW